MMARAYSKPKKKATKRKASKTKELTTLAYKLGQIEKGKKNSNSKVYDSYNKGLAYDPTRKKKPLI